MKTQLPLQLYSEFPIVTLTNPEEDLNKMMREDQHGTQFDTGCTVIVTKTENLVKEIEPKFKNLIWIVLDRMPKGMKMKVDNPVVEMFPNIISAHCPFNDKPKVSFYDKGWENLQINILSFLGKTSLNAFDSETMHIWQIFSQAFQTHFGFKK